MAGSAGFHYPALCLGAIGGVLALANIAPQSCCDVLQLFQQGRHAEAKDLQLRVIAANGAVTARFGVAGLKAAMASLNKNPTRQGILRGRDCSWAKKRPF